MRWYRASDGSERLWIEPFEIEALIEEELRRAGQYPTLEAPVVDLERFIERHLRASLDQYAELPSSELGMTEFLVDDDPHVSISRTLTNAIESAPPPPGALGRWRATLAHEVTHVILHRDLYVRSPGQASLFDLSSRQQGQPIRCLERDIVSRARGHWREVQANLGMATLLMPRDVFGRAAREELAGRLGHTAPPDAGSHEAARLVACLASRFATSRQATAIRLETLGLVRPAGQGRLT